MRRGVSILLAIVVFAAAVWIILAAGLPDRAAYTGEFSADARYIAPEAGALAPSFQTITSTGEPFDLESTRGSPVALNFWATWCVPCKIEMPELQAFHQAYPNVQVIGVNLGEPPDVIAAWIREGGYTFPIVLDLDGAIARRYALRGQPTTVMLAPDGMVLSIAFGATTRAALEAVFAPYLGSTL